MRGGPRFLGQDEGYQSDLDDFHSLNDDFVSLDATAVNGTAPDIGLGKREFREDGSFVSTIWIVIFLIPVFPLSSARLRGDCDLPWWGEFLAALHSIVTPGSSVIERLPSLHRQQVLSTYAFVASLFLCSLLFYLVASDSRSVPSMLIAGAIFLLLFLPYVLRREARRQVTNNDTMSKVS